MGLEARLLLGHCSPRLSALSGPSRIGPTDHFEGIRASHIKGQTLVEMAGTHHRSHIMENVTLIRKNRQGSKHRANSGAELIVSSLSTHRRGTALRGLHGQRSPTSVVADVVHLARLHPGHHQVPGDAVHPNTEFVNGCPRRAC